MAAASTATTTMALEQQNLQASNVLRVLDACSKGDLETVQNILSHENPFYACLQDEATGQSPLMVAAALGHLPLVQLLLEAGAPWNAVDRNGNCAGNYATDHEKWDVVNYLVEWGTRAELILGAAQREQLKQQQQHEQQQMSNASFHRHSPSDTESLIPDNQQPSTKPDYLRQPLRYNANATALLDADNDAVMMEWERPLMKAHAQILMEQVSPGDTGTYKKRVLNVGFGMGIIDTALQELGPSLHIIIEAHPDVYQHMLALKWNEKPHVRICFGRWQDVMPQLIQQGVVVDAVFFDTYGEHFMDMEDFHQIMVKILSKPHGIYSFFNGLAPDNLFFHGVGTSHALV
jgi:type IV protein arginine methyltransferase